MITIWICDSARNTTSKFKIKEKYSQDQEIFWKHLSQNPKNKEAEFSK